jgi:isomerase DpgB
VLGKEARYVTTTINPGASSPGNDSTVQSICLTIENSAMLSADLVRSVVDACERAENPGEPAVLVLRLGGETGERPWPDDGGIHVVSKWEQALRRLERVPVAIIAVARGVLTGPGVEALLVADHRVATRDLTVTLPVHNGSIWPGMLLYRLSQQLGVARTRRLALLGTALGADAAARIDLIDEVVADEAAASGAVARIAGEIEGITGTELAIRRRLLTDAVSTTFEEALGAHLSACDRTLRRRHESDARL